MCAGRSDARVICRDRPDAAIYLSRHMVHDKSKLQHLASLGGFNQI